MLPAEPSDRDQFGDKHNRLLFLDKFLSFLNLLIDLTYSTNEWLVETIDSYMVILLIILPVADFLALVSSLNSKGRVRGFFIVNAVNFISFVVTVTCHYNSTFEKKIFLLRREV